MNIEVITSITDNKDRLISDQNKGNAFFTAYLDDSAKESSRWNIKPAYDLFKDPRRNSRIHKILIHKYSNADVTIWIDGRMKLLFTPEELVEKYLKNYDMAIFSHITRDCVYEEAVTCARLGLDDPKLILEQVKHYQSIEFPEHKGLCEGGFIIRRNNERTRNFNEAWWADYCRFSRRDQISLVPALDKAGVIVNMINEGYVHYPDGTARREGQGVEMFHHLNFEGNFNEKK